MTSRRRRGLGWLALVFVTTASALAVGAALAPASRAHAADCSAFAAADDATLLFSSSPPAVNFGVSGPAPFDVSVSIREGIVVFPQGLVTSSFDFGDGSGSVAVRVEACTGPATEAYWPAQTFRHRYGTPGSYQVKWNISVGGVFSISPVVLFVTVTGADPTPTPPPPTATPVAATATPPAPTATQQASTATPSPGTATPAPSPSATAVPSATPPEGSPTAAATTTTATAAASASPAVTSTSGAETPTPAASPTASPTATPAGGAAGVAVTPTPGGGGEGGLFASTDEMRTEMAASLPDFGDLSTDGAVIATNLVLAGITVWVLFSSVFLNQVLQDNRDELDAKTARLASPFRRLGARAAGLSPRIRSALSVALVMLATAVIYGFLDPAFGLNRASLLLVIAILAGVGVVTYVCSGTEVLATRRLFGAAAAVKPFAATIVVAIASVIVSRLAGLQPGVIYGFVASCAVAGELADDRAKSGRVALYPIAATALLSVAAFATVGPLRAANRDGGNGIFTVLETVCVIVFVGGIEGLFFNMIPLSIMDGGKLFRWRKWAWAGFAVPIAFAFWHVLLNHDRSSFDALRQASSLTVLVIFVAYSLLSIGAFAFFRLRERGHPVGSPAGSQ